MYIYRASDIQYFYAHVHVSIAFSNPTHFIRIILHILNAQTCTALYMIIVATVS